jgi:hypothetical protein
MTFSSMTDRNSSIFAVIPNTCAVFGGFMKPVEMQWAWTSMGKSKSAIMGTGAVSVAADYCK